MKKILTLALALALATASGNALAARAKCTVKAVDEKKITLTCPTSAEDFKVGQEVIIQSSKTRKAIEGC